MNQKKNRSPDRKAGVVWLVVVLILLCEFMTHIWIRTESTQAILDISQAQTRLEKARSYTEALSLERVRLKSEARITAIAKARLGLIQDTFSRTVYLPGVRN